jgi:hypothetical protein
MLDDIYSDPWGNDPPPDYRDEPQPEPPPYVPPPMGDPRANEPATPPPSSDNTTGSGGKPPRRPRADVEAEGRAHDAAAGLYGGWYNEDTGEWVNGSPWNGQVYGDFNNGSRAASAPAADYASGFQFPHFNAPTYTPGAAFVAPPPFEYAPFSYGEFKAPQFSDIYNDGSYTGRRDEGLNAIQNSAAAKGLTRLPATLKALAGWNQDFASREYGNIFDRAATTYDRNRNNAFGNWQANRNNAADNYSLNYGIARDVWDRGEKQNLDAFDRNYRSAYDAFDFNEFKPASMTFDDMYRRWKAQLDATTSIATAGANL